MHLIKDRQNFFFQFEALKRSPGLWHAVTTRLGGESRGPYAGFNLALSVGDDPQAVAGNRERLHQITGRGVHLYCSQNHGTTIHVVREDDLPGKQPIQAASGNADALITDVPGVFLLIQTADCQAVMIHDPQQRVVANVHSGWRGSVADIVGLTVTRMVEEFGCDPGRMVAAIGPSLGPCCAEFVHYKEEIPRDLWPFKIGENHFDFWRISRKQLLDAGLAGDRIHTSNLCTRCNPHLFFSYRGQKQTGRFAAIIGLNP